MLKLDLCFGSKSLNVVEYSASLSYWTVRWIYFFKSSNHLGVDSLGAGLLRLFWEGRPGSHSLWLLQALGVLEVHTLSNSK